MRLPVPSRAALVVVLLGTVVGACSSDDTSDDIPLFPGGSLPPTVVTVPDDTGDLDSGDPDTGDPGGAPVVTTGPPAPTDSPTPGEPTPTNPPVAELGEPHPLDGLTGDEMTVLRDVLAADGKLDGSQFPYVGLQPPDKAAVLAWQPGSPFERRAFAIVRRDNETFEAVVNLQTSTLESWLAQPGAQPGFVNPEFGRASGAARQDPRFVAGLAARNLTDDEVICLMFAAGASRAPEEQGRRLGRVTCYLDGDDPYYFSRPVEGLYATVDLETGEVVAVADSGPVAVPTASPAPDPARQRPPLTPIGFDTSAGSDLTVEGSGAEWAGWTFRWRGDRRTGVELADVRFDAGDGPRRVLYEAYLADLFVPYQHPDPGWAFRTLLDSAEFGLGATLSRLTLGVDCPEHATLLDVPIPNDAADLNTREAGACLFERPTGNPAWRHQGSGTDQAEGTGAPEQELVVRFISTVGNYDYIVDYVFRPDGTIRFHTFAAGVVLQRADATVGAHDHSVGVDQHGVLVGDGLVGVNHDHYLAFRLDLDVGETPNRMVRMRMNPEPVPDNPNRTQIWSLDSDVVASELGAVMTPNAQQPEMVMFESTSPSGPLGHHPGYHLDFGDAVAVAPGDNADEPGLRRGGWAENTLWVTPYDPAERYASGRYVPDGSAPAGLPAWVARDRPLADQDLVVWVNVGFHHVVRTEDLPTMPVHEAFFALMPMNITATNPYLDLIER